MGELYYKNKFKINEEYPGINEWIELPETEIEGITTYRNKYGGIGNDTK